MTHRSLSHILKIIPILMLSSISFAQDTQPDPNTFKFIRVKTVTDMVCGSSPNFGSGPQCGEPTITWNAASSGACNPIQAQDSRCPVAEYYRGRSAECGAEVYRTGTAEVCGTEKFEFWSGWGKECPPTHTFLDLVLTHVSFQIFAGNVEFRITFSGVDKRVRCTGMKPKSCRHPQFGVEVYQECNLGVKNYQSCTVGYETCRHPNHGEESRVYPGCRHESFGITPNTCTVPDLAGQSQSIEQFVNEISAYKFILSSIRTAGQSFKSTMTSTLMVIESTIEKLSFREAELTKQLNSRNSRTKTETLQKMLAETQENLADLRATADKLNQCSNTESICDLDPDSISSTFENQLRRAQIDLGIIRSFLQSEADRWKSISESMHLQIIELLNSPQLKDAMS